MALSNFIKGYRNNDFVADVLFPRLPVLRQTDKYYIFGRESQQLRSKTLRAPGAGAESFRFTLSTGNYTCVSRAQKGQIPDEDRAAYTLGDLTQTTAEEMQKYLMFEREARVAAMATTAANYTNSLTLAGGSQWSDYANSDPVQDVENAKAVIVKAGVQANTLVLSDPTYRKLRNHPKIIARTQYKDGFSPNIGTDQLAAIFDVPNVVVASAIKDNGDNTQTFLWGKSAILCYVNPKATPAGVLTQATGATAPSITPSVIQPVGSEGLIGARDLSFGKTFVWVGAPNTVGGYGVILGRDPDITAKSDVVGVDWYAGEQITAQETGFLFANAVA
jgi:hypothetical protein